MYCCQGERRLSNDPVASRTHPDNGTHVAAGRDAVPFRAMATEPSCRRELSRGGRAALVRRSCSSSIGIRPHPDTTWPHGDEDPTIR